MTLTDLRQPGRALSTKDFAVLIGRSHSWVKLMCREGHIPAQRVGYLWKIPRQLAYDWAYEFLKPAA